MNCFLEKYKIKIKTISPIYIGMGETINKKEYIYDKAHGKVHILDIEKMFSSFLKRGLDVEFEKYLMHPKKNLYTWFYEKGFAWKEYSKWIKYSLNCKMSELGENEAAISLFIKDKYGNPYVPGSSLKGAIRTALVGTKILELKNPDLYRQRFENALRIPNNKGKKAIGTEMMKLEKNLFVFERKNEEKNDKMMGIRIADSKVLTKDCLTICKKVDLRIDRKENYINVLRECIKPGTEIEFDMTIDKSYNTYNIEDILDAINVFYEYCSIQSEKFEEGLSDPNDVIYLGGGSGFISKTNIYELFDEKKAIKHVSNILNRNFKKHHHYNDLKLGVSPRTKKCTYYDGKRYEFGLCKIEINPV